MADYEHNLNTIRQKQHGHSTQTVLALTLHLQYQGDIRLTSV